MNRIDLTKNKLFTQLQNTKTGIIYTGKIRNKNIIGSLPTGTKREMASRRLMMEYYNGSHCECCGVELDSLHKQSGIFGLCRKCNTEMDRKYQAKELLGDLRTAKYDDSRKLRVSRVRDERGKLIEGWKSHLNSGRRVVNGRRVASDRLIEEIQNLTSLL